MSEVFEFWAGNPSVEFTHGRIRTALSNQIAADDGAQVDATAPIVAEDTDGCAVLATSVPCFMTASELCHFLGAFTEETHRLFRHCRVLRGSSPEEYLVAIWLSSSHVGTNLLERFHGVRYNSIDEAACKLYKILECTYTATAVDCARSMSPQCGRSMSPMFKGQPSSGSMSQPMSPLLAKMGSRSAQNTSDWSPVSLPRPTPLNAATGVAETLPTQIELPSGALPLPCEMTHLFQHSIAVYRDSAGEAAKCPVCLEHLESDPSDYELTEMGGGVPLTILCGHTFHARCLFRWCDTRCPVCRYQQHPCQTSCCELCGQSDGCLICLLCGRIGCQEHARQHYLEHQHIYALDMISQRVWDFAGDGYVHRLLTNLDDGKVVEHSLPPLSPNPTQADGASSGDIVLAAVNDSVAGPSSSVGADLCDYAREHSLLNSKGSKKSESVVTEFHALLASQMTAQKSYFEEEARTLESVHKRELEELDAKRNKAREATEVAKTELEKLVDGNALLAKELKDILASQMDSKRRTQELEASNKKLSDEQRKVEDRAADKEEQRKAARQQRDREVEELQQQIRDLELYVQMRKKCEGSVDAADLQGSHLLITESSSRGRGRGGRRPKRH